MATDPLKCEVCGRKLNSFSKASTCSDKCRKAKSRLGLDAGKTMMSARNALRYVIRGLKLDVIDTDDIYSDYGEIVELLQELGNEYNNRMTRERLERERLPQD